MPNTKTKKEVKQPKPKKVKQDKVQVLGTTPPGKTPKNPPIPL